MQWRVFVWTSLLDTRLPNLSPDEREILRLRLQGLRATGAEAWLTTQDGTVTGELVIQEERPDRRP